MAVHLIIDGYNLLYSWPEGSILMREDPEQARKFLLHNLKQYQAIKRHRITLVFDAWNKKEARSSFNQKGIKVIFTASGETADDYIKKVAQKEKERAIIVSSDRAIRSYVENVGAISISSQEFLKCMDRAFYQKMKGEIFSSCFVPHKRLSKKIKKRLLKLSKL